jgi:hypothetical protein
LICILDFLLDKIYFGMEYKGSKEMTPTRKEHGNSMDVTGTKMEMKDKFVESKLELNEGSRDERDDDR